MNHLANSERYKGPMTYNRCGRSGLLLPRLSLGLWHNFGGVDDFENSRAMLRRAFDLGVTHFDLANNYGPPPGSAEETFGAVMRKDLAPYRDELVISTKAGFTMWPGPYGDWGGRKYLLASLDQSLKRMGLDHVDIFYSHRPDPRTPIEETLGALATAVRHGKALYAGISSYNPEQTREAARILRNLGAPCLIHQPSYSMLNRNVETSGLLDALEAEGIGMIAFCPLAQGLLTGRYLNGIPDDSRAGKPPRAGAFLKREALTPALLARVRALNEVAQARGQSLAQLALTWVLRDARVTSALIGASRVFQIEENVAGLAAAPLDAAELRQIEALLKD
jgi:L-glyceraldehyde 3-phosphate reductase